MQRDLQSRGQQGREARIPQVRHDGLCMKSESKSGPDPNLAPSIIAGSSKSQFKIGFAFYSV